MINKILAIIFIVSIGVIVALTKEPNSCRNGYMYDNITQQQVINEKNGGGVPCPSHK